LTSYFTVNEANKILPRVIEKFNYAKKLKDEIVKTEQELATNISATSSLAEYATLKQKLNSIVSKFYQSIEDLESTALY